jgi:pyruvate dehydrogenase E2 component (dihydrolipoamide acetyltransferase)
MRKTIAKRLVESKQTVPHYYLSVSIQMDEVLKLRANLNLKSTVKISVNDLLVKASALACIKVPECNSQWHGDKIRKYYY